MFRLTGLLASKDHKFFEGEAGRRFNLKMISTRKNNSFSPLIKGEIREEQSATYIYLNLKVSNYAMVFVAIWFLFIGFFFIKSPIFEEDFNNPIAVLFPILFILIFVVMSVFSFNKECKKAKEKFYDIMEAEETEHRSLIDKY